MSQPIEITNGSHEIKIYTVQNRERVMYQLSYYEGGKRERKTLGKMADARREAKLILRRLAINAHDVAELSTSDMESFVVARRHIEATGLPLHVCAETFAQVHVKLASRSVSLLEAVDFYLDFHRGTDGKKTLTELIIEFANGRKAMGVNSDYVENIKRQLGRLAAANPNRTLATLRTPDLDKWLGGQDWKPVTKNDVRKICMTFGNWAKANGYLPANRPTEFDGMIAYKVPATKVVIYSPSELRTILDTVQTKNVELLPWAACAAFLGTRVSELHLLRWEDISFERGFVVVASNKVRTKARRLVPLCDALRAWLLPYKKESGLICEYADPRAALGRALFGAELLLKDNGFRHSYITYRLAQTNDTARVALEAGNSPDIIFAHYRELVGPDEAAAWFAAIPEANVAPACAAA